MGNLDSKLFDVFQGFIDLMAQLIIFAFTFTRIVGWVYLGAIVGYVAYVANL